MTHIEELQEVQEMLRRSNSLLSLLHEWLKLQVEEQARHGFDVHSDLLHTARLLVKDGDIELSSLIRRLAKE